MTILDNIIAEKRKEVEKFHNQTFDQTAFPYTGRKFSELIHERKTMGIIAEIKRASPSKGMIHPDVDPVEQALAYERNGASAISVLTDTPFFKGTMDDLHMVRQAVNLPILCKDFIIDKVQIDRAKAAGATIILLIAAALDDALLQKLYHYAIHEGLEVLCEVHNEEEMERILLLDPLLIGVNNRNLKTFDVDLTTTNRIANMLPNQETILIGESGIRHQKDVKQLATAGAEAILIGETLMRSTTLDETMRELQVALPNKIENIS